MNLGEENLTNTSLFLCYIDKLPICTPLGFLKCPVRSQWDKHEPEERTSVGRSVDAYKPTWLGRGPLSWVEYVCSLWLLIISTVERSIVSMSVCKGLFVGYVGRLIKEAGESLSSGQHVLFVFGDYLPGSQSLKVDLLV